MSTEVLEEFETYLDLEGKSPNTVRMYSYYVRRYLEWGGAINARSALRFLARLRREGYSNRSLNLVVQALRAYFRFEGYDDEAEKLKPPKVPRSLPKALTREEVDPEEGQAHRSPPLRRRPPSQRALQPEERRYRPRQGHHRRPRWKGSKGQSRAHSRVSG